MTGWTTFDWWIYSQGMQWSCRVVVRLGELRLIGGYIVKECSGAVELYDWVNYVWLVDSQGMQWSCRVALWLGWTTFDWWIDKELTMVRNKMLRDRVWVRTRLMLKETKILNQSRPWVRNGADFCVVGYWSWQQASLHSAFSLHLQG